MQQKSAVLVGELRLHRWDKVHVTVKDLTTTDCGKSFRTFVFSHPHHKENLITVHSVINGFSFDSLKPSAFTTGFTFNHRNNKKMMKKKNIRLIMTNIVER